MNPYNPNLWDTTTYVNPTLMNNIEQGVANSCLSDSLGQIEQGNTSTSIYQIGEHCIFKGQRVKAISTIAIGDTLEIGTNCTRVDVQTDLETMQQTISDNDLTKGGTVAGNLTVCADNDTTTFVDTYLNVGNDIPNGTEGASRGVLGLFGANDKVAVLAPPTLTDNRVLYLPDKNGTLATGDISPEQSSSSMEFGVFQQTFGYQGTTYQNVNIAGVKIENTDFTPSRWTIFGYVIAGANLFGRFVCISSVDLTHAVVVNAQ